MMDWRATDRRAEQGDRVVQVTETPVSQLLVRSPLLDHYYDERFADASIRVAELVSEISIDVDKILPMAKMFRAHRFGPLRTQSGNKSFENGWLCTRKGGRNLPFEGMAQRNRMILNETDRKVTITRSEPLALQFPYKGKFPKLTFDVESVLEDRSSIIYEMKRDGNDLRNADYRHCLAISAEILRRCGMQFTVMFGNELFENRIHRANAELFAARAFVTIHKKHFDRLEDLAYRHGPQLTYGALAEALEPMQPNYGAALVQALTVRRRVSIDITWRIRADTPLIIY